MISFALPHKQFDQTSNQSPDKRGPDAENRQKQPVKPCVYTVQPRLHTVHTGVRPIHPRIALLGVAFQATQTTGYVP